MSIKISNFVSAVRAANRTDRYNTLSALFCLNAHVQPATTKQISSFLALHFGSKAPKNVSACLRKYEGLIEVASEKPLTWILSPQGVGKLEELSGLKLPMPSSGNDYGVDVGIVCALEHPEFEAVIAAFGGAQKWTEVADGRYAHVYRKTELVSKDGEVLKVVGITSTSMGLTAAAIATTQLILQFRPRLVIMIGIAAGTYDGQKQFGDVLVADPSVDYNSGKVSLSGGIREFLPDPYPIGLNARLRSVLQRYRGMNHEVFNLIRAKWGASVPVSGNRLHLGPLGAADQVIDDATRVTEIQRNWRKLIGVEMETYAVYRACHESPEPKPRFVSFKSVCDFAAGKSDSWQAYAAYTAAAFAHEFLKNEWTSLWPKK